MLICLKISLKFKENVLKESYRGDTYHITSPNRAKTRLPHDLGRVAWQKIQIRRDSYIPPRSKGDISFEGGIALYPSKIYVLRQGGHCICWEARCGFSLKKKEPASSSKSP